jgi:hypothetical protein
MDTIRKTYTFKGQEHEAYFKALTVLDTQKLLRGQKAAIGDDGKARMDLDYAQEYERSLMLVQLTLVDSDGRRVYQSLQSMQNEPTARLAKLIALAKEAEKEWADEGN